MYEYFTTERVLVLRLLLELYGPIVKYTKGPGNDASYALRSIPRNKYEVTESCITRETLSGSCCLDNWTATLSH